jgi:hypothetical protein
MPGRPTPLLCRTFGGLSEACDLNKQILDNFAATPISSVEFATALAYIDFQLDFIYSKSPNWVSQAEWALTEGRFFLALQDHLRAEVKVASSDSEDHPKAKKARPNMVSQLYPDCQDGQSAGSAAKPGNATPGSSAGNATPRSGGSGGGNSAAGSGGSSAGGSGGGSGAAGSGGNGADLEKCPDDMSDFVVPPARLQHPKAFELIPAAAHPDPCNPGGKHSYTIRHSCSPDVSITVQVKQRAFYVRNPQKHDEPGLVLDKNNGHHISWGKDTTAAWERAAHLADWPV